MYRSFMSPEIPIATALADEDWERATTLALEAYGPEIMRLLVGLHGDEDAAGDAFSEFAERLWKSVPKFEGKCSMRTWAYLLARRVSHNVTRTHRRRRQVPLSEGPISRLAAQIKTTTITNMRSENVSALAMLRRELDPEDQLLLVLRIEREMEWHDLALVFLGEGEHAADVTKRESARLRKRFQVVKEKLLAMGRKRGLFKPSSSSS